MSRSTPTTSNIIETAIWSYLNKHKVAPNSLFIGPLALANLRKEIYTKRGHVYEDIVADFIHPGEQCLIMGENNTRLQIVLVLEERKDFIMVCQEQEYLDYVMERVVL